MGCTLVWALTVHAVLRSRPVRAAYVRDRNVPWHRILCDAPRGRQTGLSMAHTAGATWTYSFPPEQHQDSLSQSKVPLPMYE
ncbi:hypothetical protein GCM10012286_62110 [Streptomyces lasiicapitis]|uniref:Secreted protein n=1 Tax=Streptomyces lasiicapitis TaxID=1923961 RepID=A0ABQ2MLB7_9ACTN|nr:hypothetical protein GCM10012286_62110 [Streptomyces lasiicapitis]